MNAFSARSASALLRPACSAMLSTSSDLFTLCLRICACSQEVERIYGKRSSISDVTRVVTHLFDMHTRDRRKCRVRCSPNMFRPLHTRFHAQESAAERTTFHHRKWWISRTYFAASSSSVRTRVIGEIEKSSIRASFARPSRDFTRARRASSTRCSNGTRTRTSPATKAGLVVAPSRFELPLPP